MRIPLLLTASAMVALAGCAEPADDTAEVAATTADTAATDMAVDTTMADPAMPAPGDAQGFVTAAAASDMYEIEAGKLAQQMGSAQAVKDFGAMMEREHTKSTTDLKAAAAGAEGVTVNPQLTAKQQSDLAALRAAGDRFDAVYKEQQIAAHQQTLDLLRSHADGGTMEPLKAFATKTSPVVERHLAESRDLP